MNRVILKGNLVYTPEQVATKTGTSLTNFIIAVPQTFNKDEAHFIKVTTLGRLADNCAMYCYKGQLVLVEGEIQQRKYTDRKGTDRNEVSVLATSVEFLSRQNKPKQEFEEQEGIQLLTDEELPF